VRYNDQQLMLTHACDRRLTAIAAAKMITKDDTGNSSAPLIAAGGRAGASCMQISRRHDFSAQLYADERAGCLPVRVSRGRHAICASTNFFVVVVVVARS